MRTILSKGLLALAITTVAALAADNSIGTWKLNLEKSKYTGAPMPVKSLTVTREASEDGVKQTTTGEQANGTAINASYTAKYDGKDVQVTGNAPYDTIAVKQVNDNTLTDVRKKTGGKYQGDESARSLERRKDYDDNHKRHQRRWKGLHFGLRV